MPREIKTFLSFVFWVFVMVAMFGWIENRFAYALVLSTVVSGLFTMLYYQKKEEDMVLAQQDVDTVLHRLSDDKEPEITETDWVGNRKTGVLHRFDCRQAPQISYENEVWFKSVVDAMVEGYKPCGLCKPVTQREQEIAKIISLLETVERDYVGDGKTKVFHCSSCSRLRHNTYRGYSQFNLAVQALDMGYTPCRLCLPDLSKIKCPACGKFMVLETMKKSPFSCWYIAYRCSGYPVCTEVIWIGAL